MTSRTLALALSTIATAAPASLAGAYPAPTQAPAGSADTRYCMRVEAVTGTRLEPVKCWTRKEWIEQGVDVDRDWPREGVRTLG